MAVSLQKASKTKSLLTHMVYFSVAMGCKSLLLCQSLSGVHITICFCLCACNFCTSCRNTYQHAAQSLLTADFGLRKCERVWVWVEKPGKKKTVYMCVCVHKFGWIKFWIQAGAQRSSVLAANLWHWRGSVAAVAQPANHSANLSPSWKHVFSSLY